MPLMKTIFGLLKLKARLNNTVAVIGVFDGLHRGHRYLMRKAVSLASSRNKTSVCITFHPHPQGEPYLISLKHRIKLIGSLGFDYCLVISFNRAFRAVRARGFVEDILVKFFRPWRVLVGEDFRFGYKAQGDIKLLGNLAREFGFALEPVKKVRIAKKIISSKRIRFLIRCGRLKEAERFLGRRVSVLGTVTHGAKRGRMLGYPTANINPHHEVLPKEGVYAVRVLYEGQEYGGLCNIGRRPTFSRGEKFFAPAEDEDRTIEAHLFGFKKDIYGEDLEIQFIRKIRGEKKFPRSSLLARQIQKDSQKAKSILKE